jgi:hypothetical protein
MTAYLPHMMARKSLISPGVPAPGCALALIGRLNALFLKMDLTTSHKTSQTTGRRFIRPDDNPGDPPD